MELSKDRIHIPLYISVEGEIAHKLSEIESGDKIIQARKYDAVFKTINNKLHLVYVDHACISSAEFIRKVTDYTKPVPDENQYSKLKINYVSWKDFCEKVIFIESVMSIKNALQSILNDLNVRDIFFGIESPRQKTASNTPAMKLQVIGDSDHLYCMENIYRNNSKKSLSTEYIVTPAIIFHVIRKGVIPWI
ncbi:hypothetical protein RhiirC2_790472 [Rhizophagus irregularis]|uniref:Uncharacterized protein n=1 Tax=Rhizophagus irregularis TaxID=588596 RepID=A0A2N1ML61_9GLOM|nr:hypothetical protein RhiirC2_790472 [Rhizophagus irregularis]